MSLAPLWNAGPLIVIHSLAAFAALLIGVVQLAGPKGTMVHRVLGWGWVASMALTAGIAFWIHDLKTWGIWSPIHILAAFTLAMLARGVWMARKGRIPHHRWTMIWLFVLALVVTGLFTLWPGRTMHTVVFGG